MLNQNVYSSFLISWVLQSLVPVISPVAQSLALSSLGLNAQQLSQFSACSFHPIKVPSL